MRTTTLGEYIEALRKIEEKYGSDVSLYVCTDDANEIYDGVQFLPGAGQFFEGGFCPVEEMADGPREDEPVVVVIN